MQRINFLMAIAITALIALSIYADTGAKQRNG
jgi:hypothetical protein